MTSRGVSIVVPVYNSEQSLRPLVERVSAVLRPLVPAFEIVLVDDGSRDGSSKVITELERQHDFVVGVRLMRNYGQHNALLCGIRRARYDVTVTIDDDLQNPPEEIPKLLAALGPDRDVVYGTPRAMTHGLFRNVASRLTKMALESAMGADVARRASAFRAFRTDLRQAFSDYKGPHVSIDILLTWATTRFTSIDVENHARQFGTSNYTFGKLMTHALNMMTGFSTLPLQLASWIGFVFTVFGIGILAFVLGRYFVLGYSVPGFPFLASLIALFSGAQLFALGIMGEYLARMHFRMMDRPTYAVRERPTEDAKGQESA